MEARGGSETLRTKRDTRGGAEITPGPMGPLLMLGLLLFA